MAKRRLNSEGSITFHKQSNLWFARVSHGDKRVGIYKKTKREVQKALKELQREQDHGAQLTNSTMLLKDYLPEWLLMHKNALRASSYEGYETIVRVHLVPRFGRYKLNGITPDIITKTWATMIQQGHSATVVNHCQRRLSKALNDAVRRNLIFRNPCALVTTPKIQKKEITVLDFKEIELLLLEAKTTPHHPIIFMALQTGMRRNELLALLWKDVDLDLETIHVSRSIFRIHKKTVVQPTKTKNSNRTIALSPQATLFLKSELQRQIDSGLFHGYKVNGESPVFSNVYSGKGLLPSSLSAAFKTIANRAYLNAKFNDLRHTHASILFKQNVHPKIVQERLGHSSIRVTLDIYSHLMPNMQKDAIQNFTIGIT